MALRKGLLVFGASGHGTVVADMAQSIGLELVAFLDEDETKDRTVLRGVPVLSWVRVRSTIIGRQGYVVALGVGENGSRERCYETLRAADVEVSTIVHASAVISSRALLGVGTVVAALAAVNAGAVVGEGAILNTGSVVEHDNRLGRFVHLSPNAALGGSVVLGDRTHLGLGAVVLPGVRVGADVRIGAGSVVTRDVPDGVTVLGVPAKPAQFAERKGAGRL